MTSAWCKQKTNYDCFNQFCRKLCKWPVHDTNKIPSTFALSSFRTQLAFSLFAQKKACNVMDLTALLSFSLSFQEEAVG